MLSGDLIIPGPNICNECLSQVWELEDEALSPYVAERLADEGEISVNNMIEYIQGYKGHWKSAKEAIESREWFRGALG
jgi:hypothetical protein